MEILNSLLDWLYFEFILPFFNILAAVLYFVLLQPLILLNIPIWLQICCMAVLTVILAFWLRRLLGMEEKTKKFNRIFAEKRMLQQDFQLVQNTYQCRAMYQASDDTLNNMYNTFLAKHYARFVSIYLLPLFLIMAWLNNVYSAEVLIIERGYPFVLSAPANDYGIQGLSVTFIFLVSYIPSLIIGFLIRRHRRRAGVKVDK